jgi:hypothetical protein
MSFFAYNLFRLYWLNYHMMSGVMTYHSIRYGVAFHFFVKTSTYFTISGMLYQIAEITNYKLAFLRHN